MSISDVAAELDRVTTLLSAEPVMAARTCLTEARGLLANATHGTSRPEAREALALLDQALAKLTQVATVAASAKETIKAYRTHLAGPRGESQRPSVVKPNDQDKRAALLLARLPERAGTGQKTSGYWIDEDGLEDGPLVSGQGDDYELAKATLRGLDIGPARGELFAATHVETKFAARMRGSDCKRAILVINNPPCDDGRYSCDRLLPKILRPDQEVTVYWPGGKGTYRGRRP
ncbi:DddA-like double-stranded DNA deaminase toxin [Actinokineospora sp. 24-640]